MEREGEREVWRGRVMVVGAEIRWRRGKGQSMVGEKWLPLMPLHTYPAIWPPGPMEVANIRLKYTGSVTGFPVTGAFTSYFLNSSVSSFSL